MNADEHASTRATANEYLTWKYLPLKMAIAAAVALGVTSLTLSCHDRPNEVEIRRIIQNEIAPQIKIRDDLAKRVETLEKATIVRGAAVEELILEKGATP